MEASWFSAGPRRPINSQLNTVAHSEWHTDKLNHVCRAGVNHLCVQSNLPRNWGPVVEGRQTVIVMSDDERGGRDLHIVPITPLFSITFFFLILCLFHLLSPVILVFFLFLSSDSMSCLPSVFCSADKRLRFFFSCFCLRKGIVWRERFSDSFSSANYL